MRAAPGPHPAPASTPETVGLQTSATTVAAARTLPSAPTPAPYGVRLAQAAEAVQSSISLAARGGTSLARIQLAPASLGGLQIHLQHTDDGLVARVIADHPEAAQALATHGEELRDSLTRSGTPLLRLDISTAGQPHDGSAGGTADQGGTGSPRAHDDGDCEVRDGAAGTVLPNSITGLASIALVDVLA